MTNMERSPLLRRILLATTLGVGFGILWLALGAWAYNSIQSATRGKSSWEQLPSREQLVVRPDGTPLILTYTFSLVTQSNYRDLDGRPLDSTEIQSLTPEIAMAGMHGTPGFFASHLDWSQRIEHFFNEREPTANWFFVHDGKRQGAGYFVGYERESNRLIGTIGLSGFREDSATVDERIPVRGEVMADYGLWSSAPNWNYRSMGGWQIKTEPWDVPPRLVFVPSGNVVRLVDLAARTVATVFEAPESIESVGVPAISAFGGGQGKKAQPIQVRTRQKIYTLDRTYKVTRVFTIPDEIEPRSRVSWYEIGDGRAIAAFDEPWIPGGLTLFNHRVCYRIEEDGSIRDRFVLDLKTGLIEGTGGDNLLLFALGLPAPSLLLSLGPLMAMSKDATLSVPRAVGRFLKDAWPATAAILALSTILAIAAWRRGRAFGDSRRERTIWTVFVFLLGLPAFIGYLLARRWPAREPCPTCHEKVPRDREVCANCGEVFPEPSPRGIEIFA